MTKTYITRTATVKSAKTVPSIGKTFAYVQLEGEEHLTELWIAGASEDRVKYMTNGKKITYQSAGVKESVKDNKHTWTDNTYRVAFAPDAKA